MHSLYHCNILLRFFVDKKVRIVIILNSVQSQPFVQHRGFQGKMAGVERKWGMYKFWGDSKLTATPSRRSRNTVASPGYTSDAIRTQPLAPPISALV